MKNVAAHAHIFDQADGKVRELERIWQEQADRCTELARKTLPQPPPAKGGKGKGAKVEK